MRNDIFLTIDIVCFSVVGEQLHVLLVQRIDDPFAEGWSLPGGSVKLDEPLDDAAQRILQETTGIWGLYLEQLYTFGDPGRDPRGRGISIAYYAILPERAPSTLPRTPRGGRSTVHTVEWFPFNALPGPLAFDHGRISSYARWRIAQKITYTPLAFHLLPEHFTMSDLRGIYETISGEEHDPSNFARMMLSRWDLAPVPGTRDRRSRRPARLFQYIGPREIPGTPESMELIEAESEAPDTNEENT